nr:F-box protein At2g32560-like [Ipomoea trifida]
MLVFLVTSFTFITLLCKSLSLQPLPSWAAEFILLPLWFWKDFSFLSSVRGQKKALSALVPLRMFQRRKTTCSSSSEGAEMEPEMSVLDLPDLVLECILERLSPEGLCNMASVCSSLRERCLSDSLWERHLRQKWGGIIGPAAHREWQWHIAASNDSSFFDQTKQQSFIVSYLTRLLWPLSGLARSNSSKGDRKRNSPPVGSVMSWYLALESGRFWFPAQVFNRENGHVGFMLSCYDADVSYDPRNDTFQARYPPHGRRAGAIEKGVTWDRLRAPPVDTSPHYLHISLCLNELRPGDHIEIQWRRNKEFPYGWWYGVVGHLETCDRNEIYCRCHESDTVVLEFNQYSPGSRWRTKTISRAEHREEGNEGDGFYGGIRKLDSNHEISAWRQHWPADMLE